jgi:TonB-dependent Receptor Plug Domain
VALPADFTDLPEFLVEDLLQGGAGSEAALLNLRFDSPALVDSIGADLMSRAGASDAAGAARLVAGVSTQGDKYAVIRGLPDRYISSQLNGVKLPSANENKRAVELDQFPANVLESIQVSKTFTPDQQGDASGGAINVLLRGLPTENVLEFRAQLGANSQVTGISDFLTYEGGGLSFWGKDNGKRDIQFENLGADWDGAVGVSEGSAPIDSKWALSAGGIDNINQDWQYGGFASMYYERDSSFYKDGQNNAYWLETPGQPLTPQLTFEIAGQENVTNLYDIVRGSQSVSTVNLVTLGLENEYNRLAFAGLLTHSAEDVATLAEDTSGKEFFFPGYDPDNPTDPGNQPDEVDVAPYQRTETLAYTERTTRTLQLTGSHTLGEGAARLGDNWEFKAPELSWRYSKNYAKQYEPDKRQFSAFWIPTYTNPGFPPLGIPPFDVPATYYPLPPADNINLGNLQRIWKSIREDSDQLAADLELPFEQWDAEKGRVKLGAFRDDVKRGFNQDTFANFNDDLANQGFQADFDEFWSEAFADEVGHPITASPFDTTTRAGSKCKPGTR